MSVNSFIPEVWNANVLVQLDKTLVFGDPGVTNRDYEGDISDAGDTVHITRLVDPVIRDYVPNQTVINPDALTTDEQVFTIDQCKYYAIEVDDVDKRQIKGELLTKSAARAAYRMKVAADTYIAARMVQGAGTILDAVSVDIGDSTDQAGMDALYGIFVDLKTAFDNLDTPTDGRWVAAPPNVTNLLNWDPRFTSAERYGSNTTLLNGEVGRILGFTIKNTTNAPAGDGANESWLVAGVGNNATTFASQLTKTEAYRPESSFSDAIKGLALYGAKVIEPEYLAAVPVTLV